MKKLLLSVFLLASIFTSSSAALAQTAGANPTTDATGGSSGGTVSLTPAVQLGTPQQFIGRIINSALGIVGSLALLMFIYGGFIWLTSAGSADKVTKGKNVLIWATIGLIVIFMSYAATKFVLDKITAV